MSENISIAIDALQNDKPNDFRDAINSELISRLNDRLDLEKASVASRLFGVSQGEQSNED